jgi:hypothetical protein
MSIKNLLKVIRYFYGIVRDAGRKGLAENREPSVLNYAEIETQK